MSPQPIVLIDLEELPLGQVEESIAHNGLNQVEDAMLDLLDFKFNCEAVLNGDAKFSCKEARMVAELILGTPREFLDLAKSTALSQFTVGGLSDLLARSFGLNSHVAHKTVKKIFSKKFKNYIIINKNREERKMAEENLQKLEQLEMSGVLAIAKELNVDIEGKRKVEAAHELMTYIDGIPEPEPLSDEVKMWFNVALRLTDKNGPETLEEAKQQELRAIAAERARTTEVSQEQPEAEEQAEVEPVEEKPKAKQEAKMAKGKGEKKAAEPKKAAESKVVEPERAAEKKVKGAVEKDEFGFRAGTKNSLFAQAIKEKPMTMAEVKELPWNDKKETYYNAFKRLASQGVASKDEQGRMSIG